MTLKIIRWYLEQRTGVAGTRSTSSESAVDLMAVLAVSFTGSDGDRELRDLASALRDEPDLRGRLRLRERPPDEGALGPVLEAIELAVQPATGALVAAVVAWVRSRRSSVSIRFDAGDGRTLEVDARRITLTDASEVGALVDDVVQQLSDPPGPPRP